MCRLMVSRGGVYDHYLCCPSFKTNISSKFNMCPKLSWFQSNRNTQPQFFVDNSTIKPSDYDSYEFNTAKPLPNVLPSGNLT